MRMDVVVVVVVHLRRSVGKWSNHRGMLGVVPLCVCLYTVYEKKEKEEEEDDQGEKQEDV